MSSPESIDVPLGVDARQWAAEALSSLVTLWDAANHSAWRDSRYMDYAAKDAKLKIPAKYYPTATFQAVAAFARCGVWLPSAATDAAGFLETSSLRIEHGDKISSPADVLKSLLGSDKTDATIKANVTKSAGAEEAADQSKSAHPGIGWLASPRYGARHAACNSSS